MINNSIIISAHYEIMFTFCLYPYITGLCTYYKHLKDHPSSSHFQQSLIIQHGCSKLHNQNKLITVIMKLKWYLCSDSDKNRISTVYPVSPTEYIQLKT